MVKMIVSRTCTEIPEGNGEQRQGGDSQPLEAFRSVSAYVLLGDPGAGKTTAFEMECEALGENACNVPARTFLTLKLEKHPEWRDKTLFIDGLDEVRAGSSDARTPFDRICKRLDALGKPRFRLSCREADWLGPNDRERLKLVSPDFIVKVFRLDPLTDWDIDSILKNRPDVADAGNFISSAHEKGVAGFLTNPQTLDLLAKVVGDGGEWPVSRKELFEKACDKMVRECNEEHRAAKALNTPEPADLLNAAGRLCAVQLISGADGWTLHGEGNEAYPAPDRCDYDRREMIRAALATNLFKAASDDNRFSPIHRHIAEFLAARHLAGVIDEGVPARRVIALITGKDGMVVTEMRGLSAWLATHCQAARAYLIEQDPVGVGLYGDIGGFSTCEKRALLYSLKDRKSRLDYPGWKQAAAFRALATPGMESVLRDVLTDSDQGKEHQLVVCLVLYVLTEGECLPGLSELLLEIVRDGTRWLRINYAALDAFIHNCPDRADNTSKLKALLADVQRGSVSDPDNVLLGALLDRLYPGDISPSEVWDYLSGVGNDEAGACGEWVSESGTRDYSYYKGTSQSIGADTWFWRTGLMEKSSDERVAELLDHLKECFPRLRPVLDARLLHDLPLRLLARGLEAHGDGLDTKRLHDWLDVGLAGGDRLWDSSDQEVLSRIRSWLEQRPEAQKAVILEGLSRCPESDEFRQCAFNVRNRLYGASLPADIGLWCLKQAVAMADARPHIAELLLDWAFHAHADPDINEGLPLGILQEHARRNETLEAYLNRLLVSRSISPRQQEWRERDRQYDEEQRQKKEKLLARIRSSESALRENRAAPYLLYMIAKAYFRAFAHSGGPEVFGMGIAKQESSNGGPEAVRQWLHEDRELTDAALHGLRGVIDREDVPDIEEIFDLETRHKEHYLGLPFLAALEEIERTVPEDDASQWGDDRIRKAVAFYYCYGNYLHMPSGHVYCPEWYRRLLVKRPEIVAEVLVQYGRCVFQVGDDYADPIADKFRRLEQPDHAQVAKHATLSLLRSFPIRRAPEDQSHLSSLNRLFWAAIRHADRALLKELIERKRSLKSISAAQRVRWLAAGAMVWPGKYTGLLKDFVQEDQDNRVRYLKAFFGSRVYQGAFEEAEHTSSLAGRESFRFDTSKIPLWELLICLIGSMVGPDWQGGHVSALVRRLIEDLVACPEEEASNALANLLADPALARWRDELKQAQDTQRVVRRDAGYRHPDIKQVCQTLKGGTPANPADLAALLMDRLCELARQIRTGNTDDWRQYWNVDSYNRPQDPKPEDACRDNLLSDLQEKLRPLGIDAQPEGQYANDKRADIRVFHAGFNVPVEIKKNSHPKLWSAIHNQLIAKYTIHPETDGYGIYLVFWFGKQCTTTPHERGYPDDAEEMKQWLEDSLSPEEARKISVCVIDVSIPEGKSPGK